MEPLHATQASATRRLDLPPGPVSATLGGVEAAPFLDRQRASADSGNVDITDPEVSIVIPALNEELTISEFVAWCQVGLAKAQVRGEILIVDSSTDSTAAKALAGGARVLVTPTRGLGRAYIRRDSFYPRKV